MLVRLPSDSIKDKRTEFDTVQKRVTTWAPEAGFENLPLGKDLAEP